LKHIATESFWRNYYELPEEIRKQADKQFAQLQENPRHPSLQFKKIRAIWSARVNDDYRALALEESDGLAWFWIGKHGEYDRILKRR
jgi:mRNA-degrading endonuclease RelE of RelBE toxin-antitoxin system